MRKLLIVFGLLLLLGVAVEVSAQERIVYEPFCSSVEGIKKVAVAVNNKDQSEFEKAMADECIYTPVLVVIGKSVGTLELRGRMVSIRAVLVSAFVERKVILGFPEPVVMYGLFPLDGKEA